MSTRDLGKLSLRTLGRINEMEGKEPYASQKEFNERIVHYRDVPLVELAPGGDSHLVAAENITVSFLTMEPNSCFTIHRHESEQVMIVVSGECDEIVEGKLYHLKEGDVIILPSNVEHGAYICDKRCEVIDIFSPSREDLVAKLKKVYRSVSP